MLIDQDSDTLSQLNLSIVGHVDSGNSTLSASWRARYTIWNAKLLLSMIRHFFDKDSTNDGVGLHYDKYEKLRGFVRGKKRFHVKTDAFVTFKYFDHEFNQMNPKGAAEFDLNIWKFEKDQDLRLRVGYEIFEKVPYMQIRENNWTLNPNLKGKWNVRFDL